MTVFVCVDSRGGMMFNKRRQSRDVRVIEDIIRASDGEILYISDYSEELFSGRRADVICVQNPLDTAPANACVFVEGEHLGEYIDKIDKLVIYNWGEAYPFDFKLDIAPKDVGFKIKSRREFVGNSHKKVTREDFIK